MSAYDRASAQHKRFEVDDYENQEVLFALTLRETIETCQAMTDDEIAVICAMPVGEGPDFGGYTITRTV